MIPDMPKMSKMTTDEVEVLRWLILNVASTGFLTDLLDFVANRSGEEVAAELSLNISSVANKLDTMAGVQTDLQEAEASAFFDQIRAAYDAGDTESLKKLTLEAEFRVQEQLLEDLGADDETESD